MPSDTVEYREAFLGGGGVFFSLPGINKVWLNDLNQPLMEVYTAFRDRPEEFIKLCRSISAAVVGEEEISTKGTGKAYNARLGKLFEAFKYDEGMDQALRYLFLNRTVWAGRVTYERGMESRLYYSNPSGWNIVHKPFFLENIAKKLQQARLSNLDYSELLKESGERVWIYLDPPYVVDTGLAKSSKLYEFGFSDSDHRRFAEACLDCEHKLCISYDDNEVVRGLFSDAKFRIYEHSWTYSGTQVCSKKRGVFKAGSDKKIGKELIITNYDCDSVSGTKRESGSEEDLQVWKTHQDLLF